ncbi:MAG: IS66 family insertion sequence element accessory protein TnpB [Acetobacteraceae bacterium]
MILDLPARPGLRILVTARPVDFRRGMDALAALVKETLQTDPFAGDVFVFRPKRADRLKILVWDGSGLVLLSKRLERGRFTWPPVRDGAVTLSTAQLALLFSGLDWSQVVPRTALLAQSARI